MNLKNYFLTLYMPYLIKISGIFVRQAGLCLRMGNTHLIVVTCVNISAHAEVCDLYSEAFSHQTVPACQVTVYKALFCQVLHACRDLQSY
jgi:hypothetical protein